MSYINSDWKFSPEDLEKYWDLYVKCVESVLTRYGIVDVVINPDLFYWAMSEVSKDFQALYSRRLRQGIAEAKVMGVMVFRLSRVPIVQICLASLSSPEISKKVNNLTVYINTLSALLFVGKIFNFKFRELPQGLIKELLYCIVFRHVNQEILGLFFDVCLRLTNL